MSSEYWFRSWHGAPMDHKWAVIAARSGAKVGVVSAIAWALMDYASQHEDRGSVEGFDVELYAVYSGFAEDEIAAVMKAMNDKGFIEDGRLKNWLKRQPVREDNSRERVTRFRDKKRSVTQCNAPDTDTESDTETDTETDTEAEGEFGAAAPLPTGLPAAVDYDHLTPIEAQQIPEIKEYVKATGRLPGRPLYRKVTELMRERRFRAKELQNYWTEWNARGYNPNAIGWLTDWACAGTIPPARGSPSACRNGANGRGNARAELDELMQELKHGESSGSG